MVGDGIKVSKEAKKMPGVKRLYQESENLGKSPFIFGRHFGVVGLLAGTAKSLFCIPVMAEIHEGVEKLRAFQGKQPPVVEGEEKVTNVTLMLSLADSLTRLFDQTLYADFRCLTKAVGPTFLIAKECVDHCESKVKGLKNLLGSFYYRFWTKAMPKLSKKTSVDLGSVTDLAKQRLIAETANAIEGFVNLGCIALGTLQILALNYPLAIWKKYTGWLRTKRTVVPSEEIVRLVITESFSKNWPLNGALSVSGQVL